MPEVVTAFWQSHHTADSLFTVQQSPSILCLRVVAKSDLVPIFIQVYSGAQGLNHLCLADKLILVRSDPTPLAWLVVSLEALPPESLLISFSSALRSWPTSKPTQLCPFNHPLCSSLQSSSGDSHSGLPNLRHHLFTAPHPLFLLSVYMTLISSYILLLGISQLLYLVNSGVIMTSLCFAFLGPDSSRVTSKKCRFWRGKCFYYYSGHKVESISPYSLSIICE